MTNRYYRNAKVFEGTFFGIPDFIYEDFSDIPGKEFLIQEGDRIDIIAEQVYGDATLWKAIFIYNDLGYFFELVPGNVIMLPLDIGQVLARI